MRRCPVCEIPLSEATLRDQVIDRCVQCNGIYFDKGELESIVQMIEMFNQSPLEESDIDSVGSGEKDRLFACPVDGQIMAKRDFGGVVIDICELCQGIWLDDREISALMMIEEHIKRNLQLYIRLGQ
jgi:Zn-finger nucleic acid-binding protein